MASKGLTAAPSSAVVTQVAQGTEKWLLQRKGLSERPAELLGPSLQGTLCLLKPHWGGAGRTSSRRPHLPLERTGENGTGSGAGGKPTSLGQRGAAPRPGYGQEGKGLGPDTQP